MPIPSPIHNKSHILLVLAANAYLPNQAEAEVQAQLRRGFEAIVDELRRIEAIPAADIDQFVAKAKAGASHEELLPTAVLFANFLPDVDYYAALVGAGFSEEGPPLDLEFLKTVEAMYELEEKHGDAVEKLPEYTSLLFSFVTQAPPEIKQLIRDQAHELGLLPKVTHVDEHGRPVYTMEQAASSLGVPMKDLERMAEEHTDEMAAIGGLHTGPVFPVQ
ncbi:MAG: hypothetical protein ACN6O3_10025 [Comamonas sp.]